MYFWYLSSRGSEIIKLCVIVQQQQQQQQHKYNYKKYKSPPPHTHNHEPLIPSISSCSSYVSTVPVRFLPVLVSSNALWVIRRWNRACWDMWWKCGVSSLEGRMGPAWGSILPQGGGWSIVDKRRKLLAIDRLPLIWCCNVIVRMRRRTSWGGRVRT